ncbi:uncharacterized protein METZ01_LOCUS248506, partial [marine metagenome]
PRLIDIEIYLFLHERKLRRLHHADACIVNNDNEKSLKFHNLPDMKHDYIHNVLLSFYSPFKSFVLFYTHTNHHQQFVNS